MCPPPPVLLYSLTFLLALVKLFCLTRASEGPWVWSSGDLEEKMSGSLHMSR